VKYLPWVILGLALFAGWSWHERKVGELNGKIAHWQAESKRVDTLYRRDTLTLTRVRRITDSILVHQTDTVRLIVAREREACDRVIETCEYRVAYRDSIIGVLKKKPSVWSKLPWVAAGVLGGVLLSK
jgi:hypothetical protein